MIRIGVIEDEARMREEVCRYVEKTAGDFAEIQCRAYESAEQFLEENSEYEILILDIRLPELLAGVFLSGYSIYRYSQRRTVESMLVLCLFFIGLYMICHNGWGIALQRRKRNLAKYLDSLPGQHMVLHRF